MSENNNSFTKEKQDQAIKWINEKWKHQKNCEVCGSTTWELAGHFTSPLTFSNGGIQIGGTSYPCVSVVCKTCANTKHFNAVVMGLIEPAKKDGGENGQK